MIITDCKGMYTIKYDVSKNQIVATVHKMLYGDDFHRYGAQLVDVVENAKNHFTMLFDMTESKPKGITDEDVSAIKSMKEFALSKGMKKSAFVMSSTTLRLQLKRNLSDTIPEDGFFETLQEAEDFLNT